MKKNIFKWLPIFVMAAVCVGFASCGDDDEDENVPTPVTPETPSEIMQGTPLTMEAISDGTFTIENGASGIITYKIDGGESQTIAAKSKVSIPVTAGQKVEFFGDNNCYHPRGTHGDTNFKGSADFYLYGNIMSLITSTDYATAKTLTAEEAFFGVFSENYKTLRSHPSKPLVLPATTLSPKCYSNMFEHCHNLTIAPELPATTLAEGCYTDMFQTCSSLVSAPKLPATTLARKCYGGMFSGCKSLAVGPELPVTTLAEGCYEIMFRGCTSLTAAPKLPATTLAEGCYSRMFEGCASLNTAPVLPATTLAKKCYDNMFSGCTGLSTAPKLPATTLAEGCYQEMFEECTSLTTAPVLPATTLAKECYWRMFAGCKNLNYVKCLADIVDHGYYLYGWLFGVAESGTFVKASGVSWPRGSSGIPDGWTIQNQ